MAPSTALLIPAAGLAGAFALLLVALRGRLADAHPYCRRCGFDLFGKPADSTRCGECGADLARRRAVRTGRRERRRRLLAAAVPALLLSGGWLGFAGWRVARAVDWDRRKPVGWLARDAADAGGQNTARRDAALAELARRLRAGELTNEQLAAVADRGLAYQADAAAPWVPAWGEWMETAHRAKRLPDDRWRRYARQTARPHLVMPAAVRRGEPLAVTVCPAPPRMAAGRWFTCRLWLRSVAVDGTPVGGPPPKGEETTGGWGGCLTARSRPGPCMPAASNVLPAALAAFADGPHTVRCTYRLRVSDKLGKEPPLTDETVELTAPFMLLPADAPAPVAARNGPDGDAGDADPG